MSASNEGLGAVPNPGSDPAGATPPAPNAATTPPAPEAPLGEPGLRALQAERDARAEADRQVADLQRQLDEINAAQLSDLERAQQAAQAAQEAQQAAQAAAEQRAAEAARWRFAATNGVPAAWVERLRGSTDEELAADWETLRPTLVPAVDPNAPRVPAPLPNAGPQGGVPQTEEDLLYEQIYGSPRK
ncbi:hypothetical protein K3M35_05145 [Rhodococcus sp. DMU2021]|uniref:hypothetical protein n=1 Tax=Rhodococcus sp. DMU2021 TaxID=2866997 RepID=UPI001C7DEE9C|nr:hypothetical protein [Rhodococcus sp. DMU2021]MBX4168052.1 hypothetical protein [Rhodococcus sp. DMU2021]